MFDTVVPRKFARLDASIGASEPHDFAVRISIIRPARIRSPDAAASTASRSAFVTCARPSVGRTVMGIEVIWVRWQAKFLNFRTFVARPSGRLPLRPGREPINSEWSTDVRFGAHNGLKSDIAPAKTGSDGPYSMTSSARASSDGGIERPSSLAVRMFSTNSNFTGCSIGRSEALAPCRILDTWLAARR